MTVCYESREKRAVRYARLRALQKGLVAPCVSCGADAALVPGERPRCRECIKIRVRPDAEIDWLLPWEQDEKAQELVEAHGAFDRVELAKLMGVSAEMLRLIEKRVEEKLVRAFEQAGVTRQDILSWLMRNRPSSLLGDL
jgi:hypothetical protein